MDAPHLFLKLGRRKTPMDSKLKTMFRPKDSDGPRAEMTDGVLIIDCRGCGISPDPGTPECIRCMVSFMCEKGGTDRVVLRTGKDTEVSGKSGKILKETSSVMRWSVPYDELKGRCRVCEHSRKKIMDIVWGSFPGDGVSEARIALGSHQEGNIQCDMCVMRTRRALDQIDRGLAGVLEKMAEYRGGFQ